MQLKLRINKVLTSTQNLGIFDITDESKIRVIIEDAGPSNIFEFSVRLKGQSNFLPLQTLVGSVNQLLNIYTYEEILIKCTAFDAIDSQIKIHIASFSEAGGSAIESIGVPSGNPLTNFNSFDLTSSNNSINIVGDDENKTIDLTTSINSLPYTPAVSEDWNTPEPDTINKGLDQLAERTTQIEEDLPTKIDSSEKGAADGVVPLNSNSKIDSLYLPSYVDDVEEYSDLSSFPVVGEFGKIYVALDTNKTYRWSGSVYVEISASEVNSVNGYTGIIVLDKADIGLDQVDNTSDVDKPISNATQLALDGLDERTNSLENINEVLQIHAFEDNVQIWGSAEPPVIDPLVNIYGNELVRDGWYFENTALGQQVAWYFFDGTTQATIQKSGFNCYAVLTMDVLTSKPIFGVYSFPTGSGDVLPGFAHSRWSYQISTANLATMTAGKKYLLYVGENPDVHPEVPHIPVDYVAAASGGDRLDTEIIFTSSLVSDPTEPVGEVKWLVESLGVSSALYKHEMALRIKKATQKDFLAHVNDTDNPHSVTAFQVGLGNVDNTSDLDKPISTATQNALDDKANLNHTQDLSTLNQSGAVSNNYIKWNGSEWIPANLEASITDFTPTQPADWDTSPLNVTGALDELAFRIEAIGESSTDTAQLFVDMKEPTGFVNREDSYINFDNTTRIFSIAPTGIEYSVYHLGLKTTINTMLTVTIPNISGNYYFYINNIGQLKYATTFDIQLLSEFAYCSYIYFDAIDGKAVIFGDERHGITMDGVTHAYLHTTRGTQLVSGAAISYSLGSGNLDADAQISLGDLQIKDEDITVQITNNLTPSSAFQQVLSPIAEIPIVYREGSIWKKTTATQFPMLLQSGNVRASYNEFTGITWQLTEAPSNNKTLVTYIFATTSVEEPIIAILGQSQYNNIDEARGDASWENISFGDLPSPEMKLLYTLYYETSSGFDNTVKCAITYVADHRFTHDREVSAAVFNSDHSNLSGLGNDDHLQYHTDARGDARYYTKTQIDSTVSGLQSDIDSKALDSIVIKKDGTVNFTNNQSMGGFNLTDVANPINLTDAVNLQTLNTYLGSTGDIVEKSYNILTDAQTNVDIVDFYFPNETVRSFEALVSVAINAASSVFECFEIKGIQKNNEWKISVTTEGDYSGISFDITNLGQVQYSSSSHSGFVSGIIKFRAITTSV